MIGMAWMRKVDPCLSITRWITRRPESGWMNATTLPTDGFTFADGATVTTSPSLMKGVMLQPLA